MNRSNKVNRLTKGDHPLRSVLASAGIGAWEWNSESNAISMDSTTCQMFGIVSEDVRVVFREFFSGIHPDDRRRVKRALQNSLKTGCSYDAQYRFIRNDGSKRYIRAHGTFVNGTDGQPKQLTGICLDITTQKELDDAAAENEINYRSIFEQKAVGVAFGDLNHKWTKVNQGFCEFVGYSESELLSLSIRDITHPDDREADAKIARKLMQDGLDSYSLDKRYLRKDGSVVWANITVSLVRDAEGNPTHFIGIVKDLQEQKAAHAKLQQYTEQIQKLSLVASQTKNGVVISDSFGRIEWANEAFTRLTGYGLDEVVGRRPRDFLHGPETDLKTVQIISEKLKRRERVEMEIVNYGKSGESYWTALRIDPVFDEHGNLRQFVGICENVSKRKNAETELLKQKARFDKLLESDIVGILMCRLDGPIEQANDEFLRMIGYSRTELEAGKLNWRHITPSKSLDINQLAINDIFRTGSVKPFEKEYIHKDGRLIPVVVGATLIDEADDLILCFVLDVSIRKASEEKLVLAKRAAEKASLAKSEFLAAMSHELRTPLNGVIGMTELLAQSKLDPRQLRFVSACQSSGKSLLALINNILDFSKIEAGQLELEKTPFDLLELLDDVIMTMALRSEEKSIDILYHFDHPSTFTLKGDSNRLRQVLVNLLGNAIKFTERGKVSLLAIPTHISDDETTIRFVVEDTGIGIPEDRAHRLFRPFSQIDRSTRRKYGGTGLGLSISKNLVDAMGGTIGVESVAGVGSKFWFEITLGRVATPPTSTTQRVNDELQKLRVLIVKQKSDSRDLLVTMLQGWKLDVDVVATIEDATQKFHEANDSGNPYHLAIISKCLPGSDAFDLARMLRRHPVFHKVVTFLLAPIDSVLPTEITLFDQCLRKPVSQSWLLNAIIDYCVHRKPTRILEDSISKELVDEGSHSTPNSDAWILVAEDNLTNQLYVKETLANFRWNCDLVSNGREVLDAVAKKRYDVILMDGQMPELDGYEATREIRLREADGRMPGHTAIIALTANAIKGDRETCLQTGMDDYLSKPFNPEQLFEVVSRHLPSDGGSSETIVHPIDVELLYDRCIGDVMFAESLLDSFASDGPDRLEKMLEFCDHKDTMSVGQVAHALKGIAGTITAYNVHECAKQVECAGNAGDLGRVCREVELLKIAMQDCLEFIPVAKELAQKKR